MVRRLPKLPTKKERKDPPPALTPTGRESQLKAAALDLAEQKIRDGTASSQLLTLVLKMDHRKEEAERRLLETQIELAEAKRDAIKAGEKDGQLYREALEAFKQYVGADDEEAL